MIYTVTHGPIRDNPSMKKWAIVTVVSAVAYSLLFAENCRLLWDLSTPLVRYL